jgi:hypothetical protein
MGRLNNTELQASLKSRIRGAVEQAVGANQFEATARKELEATTRRSINESMAIIDACISRYIAEDRYMNSSEINRIFHNEVNNKAYRMVREAVDSMITDAGRVVRKAVVNALKGTTINIDFAELFVRNSEYKDF